jgi:predicted HTH transcriptional regulator
MNAPFPFRSNKIYDIRKTICSFLNHEGGILFIGIVKEENKYIVTGS